MHVPTSSDRWSVARSLLDLSVTIVTLTIVSHAPGALLTGERPGE